MEFRLLGPLEVRAEGGAAVPIAGRQPRALLALLLLSANQPVSAERIATALWGDEAPSDSVRAVRVVVSRLRRSLDEGVLATSPAGYRLLVRPGELDSDGFAALVAQAGGALEAGDPLSAVDVLRKALALWRGPALADVAFAGFAQAAVAALEEQRVAALELRLDAELELGREREVIAELQQLVEDHPLSERLHRQLMLALYRSGRQADALDVFHRARSHLAEQLGLEPGPELRRLQAQILSHDASLEPQSLDAGAASSRITDGVPHHVAVPSNLPPRNPCFTGRADAVAALRTLLVESGRVEITGMPGVGKTQVALAYADHHRADYAALLWLRAETWDALYGDAAVVARRLGLSPVAEGRQELVLDALVGWLAANTGWLLVLDNTENREVVAPLLASDGGGHVLITTREAAGTTATRRLGITPLDEDDAAELLLRRWLAAGLTEPGDIDQRDRAAARTLARHLGGLPLALDQAGAFMEQTRSTPTEYVSLVETESQALLAEAAESTGASVAATFRLAFRRLEEEDRAAADLLRLSTFLAPDAIPEEILTSAEPLDRLRIIRSLLRYSLIERDPQTRTISVHRVIQQVLEAEMSVAERHRWARGALQAVSAAFPTWPDFTNWPVCERLMPHALRSAEAVDVNGLESRELGRLLNLVGVYLRQRGRHAESEPVQHRARDVLERTAGASDIELAWSTHNLSVLHLDHGRVSVAEPLARHALDIAEQSLGRDDTKLTWFLCTLANLHKLQGRLETAEALLLRAIEIRRTGAAPDDPEIGWPMQSLADVYIAAEGFDEAESLLTEVLSLRRRELGAHHPHLASTLTSLGDAYAFRGDHQQAGEMFREALLIAERALGPEHPRVAHIRARVGVDRLPPTRYADVQAL